MKRIIVGVDEAGRGPLAGPVVACALFFKKKPTISLTRLKDSKQLSPRKRESIFHSLCEFSEFAVSLADNRVIDKINILQATLLCFNKAITKLIKKNKQLEKAEFIIDGNIFQPQNLKVDFKCLIKADEAIKEVSAASIVAKVYRDFLMRLADKIYPEYNFFRHKGYATKEHLSILQRKGLSEFHRKSFCYGG